MMRISLVSWFLLFLSTVGDHALVEAQVDCGTPPAAHVNGNPPVYTTTTFGSTATYTCQPGHMREGDRTITCLANGQWSASPPDCDPIDCVPPPPAAPANGQRGTFNTTFMSTVTYSCNTGYTLQGNSTLTCNASGQWTPSVPTCNVVDCGTPPAAHVNGNPPVYTSTTFGSTATYTCKPGYMRIGDRTITCLANGQWNASAPDCDPIDCGTAPAAPDNGNRGSVSTTTLGSTVIYSCDTGYTLQGSSTLTCMANRQWSPSVPTCNIVDCGTPPAAHVNGNPPVYSSTTFGSTATYTCQPGHIRVGDRTITCMANGQWSASAPDCDPISCVPPPPAAPANGQRGAFNTTFMSTVTYSCNTGYTLQGNSTLTCMANGQWSPSVPTCAISCGTPPAAPANGQRGTFTTTVGSTVTYSCNTGYTLQGSSTLTCMADEQWSSSAPTCVGPPSKVTGVSVAPAVRSNAPALMVTWDSSQSDVAITHYQVQYMTSTTSWMQAPDITGSPPATTTFLEGLEAGTSYSVQVRAVSSIGNGAWSETTSRSTYSTTPQPVMELANSALDSLVITWTVSSAMDVSSYTVYWSEVPSGAGGSRTLGNDIMQTSIPDLRSNTEYMVMVQAAGPLGKMDSTAVRYYTAPRAVSSVRVAVLSEQFLQVSWQPASDMNNNDQTVVTVTTVFGSDIMFVNATSSSSMVRISGLPEYSTGEVRVQTKNPSAMSEVTTVGVRTVTANANGIAFSAEWVNGSFTSINLSWQPDSGVATYTVTYTPVNASGAIDGCRSQQVVVAGSTVTLSGLNPMAGYIFHVEVEMLLATASANGAGIGGYVGGAFVGGFAAGSAVMLLVCGIVVGIVKLRNGKTSKAVPENSDHDKDLYEAMETANTAVADDVAMDQNPAYRVLEASNKL